MASRELPIFKSVGSGVDVSKLEIQARSHQMSNASLSGWGVLFLAQVFSQTIR